jgi:hypothetical protein
MLQNISTRPATDTIISTTPTTPAGATSSSSQDYTIIELQSLAEFSPQPNTPSTSEVRGSLDIILGILKKYRPNIRLIIPSPAPISH